MKGEPRDTAEESVAGTMGAATAKDRGAFPALLGPVDLLDQLARARLRYRYYIEAQLAADLRTRVDADDLFENAILALLRAIKNDKVQLRGIRSARGLLRRFIGRAIAREVSYQRARRRDPRQEEWVAPERHAGRLAAQEDVALVLDAFDFIAARLGAASATVFAYRVQQFSEREIATRLGIRRGRVQVLLARIQKFLQRHPGAAVAGGAAFFPGP